MATLPKKIRNAFTLNEGEKIELILKGLHKEFLICTNKQLYIIKTGFMTGHFFGCGVYQMRYNNVTNVNVNFHLATGYFEVSTGGMQNTNKSYWGQGNDLPMRSPNCITIGSKESATKFRNACNLILNKMQEQNVNSSSTNTQITDIPTQIKKLADLKENGIITQSEFETKKSELLSRM